MLVDDLIPRGSCVSRDDDGHFDSVVALLTVGRPEVLQPGSKDLRELIVIQSQCCGAYDITRGRGNYDRGKELESR